MYMYMYMYMYMSRQQYLHHNPHVHKRVYGMYDPWIRNYQAKRNKQPYDIVRCASERL